MCIYMYTYTGVTLWMTGLSGSGKSTIAAILEEQLVLLHGKYPYICMYIHIFKYGSM
jgi:adenylylsulfate kinase-like enzyme